MTYALPNIPDPLIRSSCSYLDTHSLSRLAGTSKKFHELAVQSTPAKVQLIVQQRWQDLGLRRASDIDPSDLQVRVAVNGAGFLAFEYDMSGKWSDEVLLADRGKFSPSSKKIDEQAIIGVSEHHLFTNGRKENAVMRDLQGELLSSLNNPNIDLCFEMPNQKQLITATKHGAKVACWDTSKSQALCIKEHRIQVDPAHDDARIYDSGRFGDLLVMLCGREREVGTFWTYDMTHPERPPQEVSNLGDKRFYHSNCAVTSNHLFYQSSDGSYNAYTIKEGTLSKQWEINNSTQVRICEEIASPSKEIYFGQIYASERWVICTLRDTSEALSAVVFNAATGEKKNSFKLPKFSTVWIETQFWGDEIFVMQDTEAAYFWRIPEGELLPTLKFDNREIEIVQLLSDREQMLLLYYNKSAREYRLMTLKAPDAPLVEESLCARLYATISSICSWFISFWQRLWQAALS